MTTPEISFPLNATFGFTKMFLRVMEDYTPTHAAVVFDTPGAAYCPEYPAYKANRNERPRDLHKQILLADKIVEAHGVSVFADDSCEADDLIGSLAKHFANQGFVVFIISSDKDFAQLVDDSCIRMVDTMKKKVYTPESVKEKWGVLPNQMVDFLALSGDRSDNIPGVKGIGPKTAIKLLTKGSLNWLLAKGVDGAIGKKLKAQADLAVLFRRLITIDCDLPLDDDIDAVCRVREPDIERINELFEALNFRSLM